MMISDDSQHIDNNEALSLIPVLAAVIRDTSRYLLCKRPQHKRHGALWEFPGGKVEPGETRDEAARRELEEELGVQVESVGELLLGIHDPGSPYLIEFTEIRIQGHPSPLEHDELRWCTAAELLELPLPPSDLRFAREYLIGR